MMKKITLFFCMFGIAVFMYSFADKNPGQPSNRNLPELVDCSKFTQEVAAHFGIQIPRSVEFQRVWFQKNAIYLTDPHQIAPGDQLFYSNPDHTGIAVEKEGKMGIVHAIRNNGNKSIVFNPIDSLGNILNGRNLTRTGWTRTFKGIGRHK